MYLHRNKNFNQGTLALKGWKIYIWHIIHCLIESCWPRMMTQGNINLYSKACYDATDWPTAKDYTPKESLENNYDQILGPVAAETNDAPINFLKLLFEGKLLREGKEQWQSGGGGGLTYMTFIGKSSVIYELGVTTYEQPCGHCSVNDTKNTKRHSTF